jgi:hypothetical protein
MSQAMNQVFKFISNNPGYRPSLGVISSVIHCTTFVTWGAVGKNNEAPFVPQLEELKTDWPDACWTQLSQQQASLFDKAYERERGDLDDFLLSI